MKVHFLGTVQTVTGSCYLIEACGIRSTVDCGMHRGSSEIEARSFDTNIYQSGNTDFIFLAHVHIGHSGLLPHIVHEEFKGSTYCTPPTATLAGLVLEDNTHIQEIEAKWRQKKRKWHIGQNGKNKKIVPLYAVESARKISDQLRLVEYNETFEPHPSITVTYKNAGHILGSAFLGLTVTEDGKTTRVVFSGDLGRPDALLMHDPVVAGQADYLFTESMYDGRNHKNEEATFDESTEAIAYSYDSHDKVIIPIFAVGRTQEILHCLYLLRQKGKLPNDMPILVDSPLAIRITEVFREFKDCLDTSEINLSGNMSALLPSLKFTSSALESRASNVMKEPAITISASGMCNAGRIQHYLRYGAWRPAANIVFVGYQGIGTPGRKIVNGTGSVRLLNGDVTIKTKVFMIGGFPAHTGQSQILGWIRKMAYPGIQVMLVHGEKKVQRILSGLIKDQFHPSAHAPGYLEEVAPMAGATPEVVVTVQPRSHTHMDWELLLEEMEDKLSKLHTRLEKAGERPWDEQVGTRDRILELNKGLLSVLTQL